jgi:hypothetical protein
MNRTFFTAALVATPLLVYSCGFMRIVSKKTCRLSDMLVCVGAQEKIEVKFTAYNSEERADTCETSEQASNVVSVAYLMRATTTAKVSDVEVDVGTKKEVAPGMTFNFDRESKTYQFDESTSTHKITSNEISLNLLCTLYLLSEEDSSSSSSGDADYD